MKFTIQTILSMPVDGASSHLLIFNNSIKILLDCGISRQFKFDKYFQKAEQLKTVCLVLISHSQLQYSGALAFLIDQLGMDPKIFYTTQSVVRYSPLNLHQSLLSLRSKIYSKKILNKLYKIYESINIIKPQQKKSLNVGAPDSLNPNTNLPSNQQIATMQQQQKPTIGQVQKIIYFTCFSAGGNMGSLSWRLSFGIVNIVYLVQYNNYSMYHIDGLDLAQVVQPTDILITDSYKNIDDSWMKKTQLYNKIKNIFLNFYEKNGMPFARPPILTNIEQEKKILITCYPNQALVQVMAVANKILQDLQVPESRQKIRVIHQSSRFLQLIKSQMDYFSNYFKDTIQNIEQYFIHAKNISGRINLSTFQSLDSLLSQTMNKSVEVYHIGQQLKSEKIMRERQQGEQNISKFKIMTMQDKLIHSTSKINAEQDQQKDQLQQKGEGSEISQQKQLTISEVPDQVQVIGQQVQIKANQPLHGKYLSRIGFFPRFVSRDVEQQDVFDEYGARHQYQRFEERKTIESYKRQLQPGAEQRLSLQKKQSTIQIMNIEFKTINVDGIRIDYSKIPCIPFYSYRTNFNSSIQLILTIKPDNVILINTSSDSQVRNSIGAKYTDLLTKSNSSNSSAKKIDVYELSRKNGICHLFISNQLISYKVNYIPIPQQRKLQKVKGLITYSGKGLLYIHLDCLEQKQHLQFRLDKFYRKVKSLQIHECVFTKNGIIIDGVRISRDEKRIILQGEYSQQYFKVRRLLYDFLKMQ